MIGNHYLTCPGIGLHIKSVPMNKTKKEKILYDRKITG